MADDKKQKQTADLVVNRINQHFTGFKAQDLVTIEKVFPTTVRPDLERAIEKIMTQSKEVEFIGVSNESRYEAVTFSSIVSAQRYHPVVTAAEYMDIDIGSDAAGRCIVTGMWFFDKNGGPAALLVSQIKGYPGQPGGVRVEAILSDKAGGRDEGQNMLAALARELMAESVYRGKALCFETTRSYMGGLGDLKVQQLPKVALDQVILPAKVLEILQRTVFGFVEARSALKTHGFSTKRGLLLYGPPGTGKTHFIRYLLSQLEGHTSLLVTAEQVGEFDQIMAIAQALQPSVVVIEDADLIARSRDMSNGVCSEVLLNSLLNHMDGLTEDAEILFILTTNRPDTLEEAVRDRPGRIDQAIEIPKPDAECRAKLLNLYRGTMDIAPEVTEECVRRTKQASAAFIRELARRMAQFALLRGVERIEDKDMHLAFEEMLGAGTFTAAALGADALV